MEEKFYTIKEVAKMLQVNEETVRRWIRNGSMKSDISSRKQGNIIKESYLKEFLNSKPKYEKKFRVYRLKCKISNAFKNPIANVALAQLAQQEYVRQKLLEESKKES